MIGTNPYEPLNLVMANDIRLKIKTGELAADTRLPSERELCKQWACSPITARHAMAVLRNAGLIYTVKGKGAYVIEKPSMVRVVQNDFQRSLDDAACEGIVECFGLDLQVTHSTERTSAHAEAAERLGIEEGEPVTEIAYLSRIAGKPVSFGHAWAPLAVAGGTELECPHEGPCANQSVLPRFDALGFNVNAKEDHLQMRMPEPSETLLLEMPPQGVPVIQIWRTFWAGHVAVRVAKTIYRADQYEFHYRLKI